ncbi:MAG: hypothetical protein MK160_02755 [Rhodobacteraceae bacterium]|nr:hypothetical protein [Paracoccaceae bacterium]
MRDPKRTAILHIGMPKTGTSSIQDTFFALDMPDHHYIKAGHANHGAIVRAMLPNDKKAIQRAARRAASIERQQTANARLLKRFQDELNTFDKPNLLMSAEVLGGNAVSAEWLASFRDHLANYVTDFRIIGYVRAPISSTQSGFQQLLKAGKHRFFDKPGVVGYRSVFEKYDQIFGRENVELVKYDRASLRNGDVVQDLAHRIGVALEPHQIVASNISVSHESLSLMYSALLKGECFKDYPGIVNDLDSLVTDLQGYGTKKFAVGEALGRAIIERCAEDIAWMEERLGEELLDGGSAADHAVNNAEDLHHVAGENRDMALEALVDMLGAEKDPVVSAREIMDLAITLQRVRRERINEKGDK